MLLVCTVAALASLLAPSPVASKEDPCPDKYKEHVQKVFADGCPALSETQYTFQQIVDCKERNGIKFADAVRNCGEQFEDPKLMDYNTTLSVVCDLDDKEKSLARLCCFVSQEIELSPDLPEDRLTEICMECIKNPTSP